MKKFLLTARRAGSTASSWSRTRSPPPRAATTRAGASMGARRSLYAVADGGNGLDKIEASVDGVLADIRANGVTEAELARAKKSLIADYIYESDDQENLADRYGWGVAEGRSVKDIENWPQAIASVAPDDIKRAAHTYLDLRGSVTGWLEPEEAEGAGTPVEQPVALSLRELVP